MAARKPKLPIEEMVGDDDDDDDDDVVAINGLRRYDVLLGRSKVSAMHVGNVAFRAFIDSRLDSYMSAGSRSAKIHSVVSLTNEVCKAGGRFLDPKGNNVWVKVDRASARKKVGNSMRDALKLVNKGRPRHLTLDTSQEISDKTSFRDVVDHIYTFYNSCDARQVNQSANQKTPAMGSLSSTIDKSETDDGTRNAAMAMSSGVRISKTDADSPEEKAATANANVNVLATCIGKEKGNSESSNPVKRSVAAENHQGAATEPPKYIAMAKNLLSEASSRPAFPACPVEPFDDSRHGDPPGREPGVQEAVEK